MSKERSSSVETPPAPSGLPTSAGAIILDEGGDLLILKPTYKKGWTIPGGIVETDGESPWDACRREVEEETGLIVRTGRLVVVDTRPGQIAKRGDSAPPQAPAPPVGLRLLFHCGVIPRIQTRHVRIPPHEIAAFRFVPPPHALALLRPAVSRRVRVGLEVAHCVYLEDGHRLDGVC
ncbi:RNA pyrophosphohydrolase [Austwickia sp. TVS 96-490-7B]|uniref:NUDIX domain-containing protein n=1 Tax=Austwickia sp. TVS 96-490-7B TaxID=2830843 RepID=UPI001C5782AF|nr:NUDIX hydrolase [Austwickia sp. TVS 96-490-7B]MBW3085954.1 RNA pyrophosphohydrolase [Austwickia sp. TVS 96-490-7B]